MNFYSFFSINILGPLLLFTQLLVSCVPKSEEDKTKYVSSEEHKRKLLVIENAFYTENGKLRSYPHLVSYNFEEGELVSKDTLTDKTVDLSDFKDYGNVCNSIYKNRYIISSVGGTLFDIQTKTILLKDGGSLVESIGDSLIFHLQRFDVDAYYLYDLKTHTCTKLENGSYIEISGALSPDKKYGIKPSGEGLPIHTQKDYQLILFDSANKEKTIVAAAGMGTYLSGFSSSFAEIPTYWLDNSTFIYAKYLFPSINKLTKIEIHKVTIKNGSDEKLCTIDSVNESFENGEFCRDTSGNLVFQDSKKAYVFDKSLKNNSQIELISKAIDHDFKFIYSPDFKKSELLFKQNSIKDNVILYGFKTTEGYIAIDEISVWSKYSNKWTTINSHWFVSKIGWIE